ncbi:hypothetical protein LCGC14_1461160 [marine sediment metagenome]|uniref:Uncharacterized protein n=1 Tax=marine sediment metagenome TaxID=412755 RepID=A0A0F9JF22_9ZZZZ
MAESTGANRIRDLPLRKLPDWIVEELRAVQRAHDALPEWLKGQP